MPELPLFGEGELLENLRARAQAGTEVVFLVGSALSAPETAGEPGVLGVAEMVRRAEAELGRPVTQAGDVPAVSYQQAFHALQGNRPREELNSLVRTAVLESCPGAEASLLTAARAGDPQACRRCEEELDAWSLRPGMEALGLLLAGWPGTFGRQVLTTNFDPLLTVAVKRAGGEAWFTGLSDDGDFGVSEANGTQVIHAHGHWRQTAMLHTPYLLERPRPKLESALRRLARRAALVVVGYGGWNDVFTRALIAATVNAAEAAEVLWCFYREGEAAIREDHSALLTAIAPAISAGVTLFAGIDAHRFFPRLVERQPAAEVREPAVAVAGVGAVADYRGWAASQHTGMVLTGLGRGDIEMSFDEVYVPLRVLQRRAEIDLEQRDSKSRSQVAQEAGDQHLELEELFKPHASTLPHRAIFGQPGAGKSTALKKLFRLCQEDPGQLGLGAGTIPVFVRLRRIRPDDLEQPLAALLDREAAPGESFERLGERLVEHGRLLLLLDGLDEVADESLRAGLCTYLSEQLGALGGTVRAVVSCRYAGYADPAVDLGTDFLPLDVPPLDAQQCRDLIGRWFAAAERALPHLRRSERQGMAQQLTELLDSAEFASQRLKVAISSPLMLTLLCIVVLRGGRVPRQRVDFYAECLRALLGSWIRGEHEVEPLLAVEEALSILAPLALSLHERSSQDDLPQAAILSEARRRLRRRNPPVNPFDVKRWLHEEAGVLEEFTPGHFGFLHLHIQEYLAALGIAAAGEEKLDDLARQAHEPWWREVVHLVGALPDRNLFAPLMERLLTTDLLVEEPELLRGCLAEAAQLDLSPFLPHLDPNRGVERLRAALRLLKGTLKGRKDPTLVEAVEALQGHPDKNVRGLAGQLLREAADVEAEFGPSFDFFMVHGSTGAEKAVELADGLRKLGHRVAEPCAPAPFVGRRLQEATERSRCVLLLVSPGEAAPCWNERSMPETLAYLAEELPMIEVRMPGSGRYPARPAGLAMLRRVGGLSLSGLATEIERAFLAPPAGVSEPVPPAAVHREVVEEEQTGIRFLPVPAGHFQMGADDLGDAARPIHWVRLSSFRLAETPVTNRQYSVFLETTGAREPEEWRNPRFADPDQPVVGVSWEEASAFCRWLSKTSGHRCVLPSEAQWEFAARGEEGRKYPWGNKPEPDDSLAWFDQDFGEGATAPVGSFPAGAGPFGHLDLAGNVWEWCLDGWDEKVYRARAKREVTDPVVTNDAEGRCLRGGSWIDSARLLRSAFRLRSPATYRNRDVGFRVAVVPASP